GANNSVTEVTPAATVIPAVQRWFKSLGIDVTEEGKAIFYNERLGTLMVRATLQDLATIETALQFLNMAPPQLTIRAKVMEVQTTPGSRKPVFGFESQYFSQSASSNGRQPAITGILTDEQFRKFVRSLENSGGTDL